MDVTSLDVIFKNIWVRATYSLLRVIQKAEITSLSGNIYPLVN